VSRFQACTHVCVCTHDILYILRAKLLECVYVCVCEKERERIKEIKQKRNIIKYMKEKIITFLITGKLKYI